MKRLLFDQNLSPRLVEQLSELYPASVHVSTLGLGTALDREIWEVARQQDSILVTKDADFSELSLIEGFPPKIIWIRRGNCSTRDIENLLRENYEAIVNLSDDPDVGILTLL
ncbi:MAG: DUF5615 family PIN-like protein [Chloroflexota bacterium]